MAVRAGLQGRSYVTPLIERETSETLGGDHKRRDRAGITMRQREVLRLLAEGRSMKEAAFILGVTPRTVAFHKYQVMENLNLRSNAELLQFAIKQCLV
jgi:DNA-binding NarL/FixJ family response regulator